MPTSSKNRPPAYQRQRETSRSDRAYVRIGGKKIKLGAYDSPESHRKYDQLIDALKKSAPSAAPGETTVSVVIAACLEYARRYYRKATGEDGHEFELTRDVSSPLLYILPSPT